MFSSLHKIINHNYTGRINKDLLGNKYEHLRSLGIEDFVIVTDNYSDIDLIKNNYKKVLQRIKTKSIHIYLTEFQKFITLPNLNILTLSKLQKKYQKLR